MTSMSLESRSVCLNQILTRGEFRFRRTDLDTPHVRQLRQQITNSERPLDPILLWHDPEKDTLVLLDGRHRMSAYRAARWKGKVPCLVLIGERRAALLAALGANTRHVLPLSNPERMDAAWRLVREPVTPRFKVNEIAEQSGVSIRTIKTMRKRLALFAANGEEPSGNWAKDRKDEADGDWVPLSDAQRERGIKNLVADVRDLLDWRKHGSENPILRDSDAVGEAIAIALGAQRVRAIFEYQYGDGHDEWAAFSEDLPTEATGWTTDDPSEDEDDDLETVPF